MKDLKQRPHKKQWPWFLGCAILIIWLLGAVTSAIMDTPHIDTTHRLEGPSWSNWLGYDAMGRPLSLMILKGCSMTLFIAFVTLFIELSLGTLVGALCAIYKGWIDILFSRIKDILLAFPPLLLPLALAAFWGGDVWTLILALSFRGWVSFAKVVRAQIIQFENQEFILYAKQLGGSSAYLIWRHILPNSYRILAIKSAFGIRSLVIYEASLSFLGVGLQDNTVSWGRLLLEGREYLMEAPHIFLWSSLSLASLILGLLLATQERTLPHG